jgi:DNA recombination protein RmuC
MDDPIILAAMIIAVALVVVATIVALARRPKDRGVDDLVALTRQLAEQQQAFQGRLDQVAAADAQAQTQLADRMQAQERHIAEALDKRLGELQRRVGETLETSSQKTSETLGHVRERLSVIEEAQKNITELSSQVVGLQDILSNKQARGAFGEVQLNDIVTAVLPPSAFTFQATIEGHRADCLINLPNPPGPIAIDSKFPLESYRALVDAPDEAAAVQARRQFSIDVRKHIQDIARKYIVTGQTAESALMFLPAESIYAELHANFPNVIEESYRARVWIVSPTTLWATLNTIRAVLKDVRMREQAGVIQSEVASLLKDVGRLDERVGKLQRHFDMAHEDLRQIRISADKVTKRGERIDELQLSDESEQAAGERTGELTGELSGLAQTKAS